MEQTKVWYKSVGTWAGIVTGLSGVLVMAGVFSPDQAEVAQSTFPEVIVGLFTAITGAVAAWGRVRATTVIEKKVI